MDDETVNHAITIEQVERLMELIDAYGNLNLRWVGNLYIEILLKVKNRDLQDDIRDFFRYLNEQRIADVDNHLLLLTMLEASIKLACRKRL